MPHNGRTVMKTQYDTHTKKNEHQNDTVNISHISQHIQNLLGVFPCLGGGEGGYKMRQLSSQESNGICNSQMFLETKIWSQLMNVRY